MSDCAELFGTPRAWARDLAIATGLGVLLGVLGPFGSFYAGPLEARLFYWVANLWIGYVAVSLAVRLSVKAGERLDVPSWFSLPAGTAVACLPLSLLVNLFAARFWPGLHGRFGSALELYGQTLAIAEPCALLFHLLGADRIAARTPPPAAPVPLAGAPARADRFGDRLSTRVGRDLLCLQMEDHYVRAHTVRGSELILLPLKDAIAELGEVDGLQVHRSWWVARAAVVEEVRDGRNVRLRLRNGLEAPVSRAALTRLREAEWLVEPASERSL